MRERTSARRQSKVPSGRAQLLEVGERLRVGIGVSAETHCQIVAAVLALSANPVREPPHGGMIEEQCFHHGLEKIDQIVMTPDMGKLVRQEGAAFGGVW